MSHTHSWPSAFKSWYRSNQCLQPGGGVQGDGVPKYICGQKDAGWLALVDYFVNKAFVLVISVFMCSCFGIWNGITDAFSVPLLENAPNIAFFQIVYLGCIWEWIQSHEQNSVPNVEAIYQSRLYSRVASQATSIIVAKETAQFSVLGYVRHWERTTTMCPKLALFLTADICSRDVIWNFVTAFDRN